MNNNKLNQEDNPDFPVDIGALEYLMLERVNESFHEFHEALGADNYNKFLQVVKEHRKLGKLHGLRVLLTMLKTYKATAYWFDLSHGKKIELARLLWREACTEFDDIMEFEPQLLTDEEVRFARLVADAAYTTARDQAVFAES